MGGRARLNLLISNPYFEPVGGTENRISALAAELRKRGHKTSFLVSGEPGAGHETPDYTVYRTMPNMSRLIASKIIERDKIDLVQVHNYQHVGNGAILAAERRKIPSVYYAHDFCSLCVHRFLADGVNPDVPACKPPGCMNPYDAYVNRKETETLQHAKLGIAPSKFFINTLEAYNVLNGKWRKVTPWIAPQFRDFFWSGYCSNTILFAGNMSPGKGVFTLIQALPKVLKEIPDVTLRIFAGYQAEPVVLEARRLKVAQNVVISRPVPPEHLVFEYVNAGLVCFPSRLQESFGLVWAEAMTVGAPVLCSATGSIPELAQGKIPLVKAGDVDAWAEAILTVLQDRAEAVKLAKENKPWAAREFSVERACDEILKTYEGIA